MVPTKLHFATGNLQEMILLENSKWSKIASRGSKMSFFVIIGLNSEPEVEIIVHFALRASVAEISAINRFWSKMVQNEHQVSHVQIVTLRSKLSPISLYRPRLLRYRAINGFWSKMVQNRHQVVKNVILVSHVQIVILRSKLSSVSLYGPRLLRY